MIDYLIVGQGLAGTWLSYFLLQQSKSITVIDDFDANVASRVASGVINPFTGKRLVKSWLIDTLLPFAHNSYRSMEELLQVSFYEPKNIIWVLNTIQELNDFCALQLEDNYKHFIKSIDKTTNCVGIKNAIGYALVQGAAMVNMPLFLNSYRNYLQNNNLLQTAKFNYNQLQPTLNSFTYNKQQYKNVVFCEGAKAIQNPFFNNLPFTFAKGEVLLIKAPKLNLNNQMLKGKVFITPYKPNIYWVGSTYTWNDLSNTPSAEQKQFLLSQLQKHINTDFEVINHIAAIRPTIKDRRPILGEHPIYNNLFIFNGLGTKGVSLSPFFANCLVNFIENKIALPKEVVWNR